MQRRVVVHCHAQCVLKSRVPRRAVSVPSAGAASIPGLRLDCSSSRNYLTSKKRWCVVVRMQGAALQRTHASAAGQAPSRSQASGVSCRRGGERSQQRRPGERSESSRRPRRVKRARGMLQASGASCGSGERSEQSKAGEAAKQASAACHCWRARRAASSRRGERKRAEQV